MWIEWLFPVFVSTSVCFFGLKGSVSRDWSVVLVMAWLGVFLDFLSYIPNQHAVFFVSFVPFILFYFLKQTLRRSNHDDEF